MIRRVFSIILLALIGHLGVAKIDITKSKQQDLTPLHYAAIDILMTCRADPGNAVGILGDSSGSVLRALQWKYFVPVVLFNGVLEIPNTDASSAYQLQAFVIAADSVDENMLLMQKLATSVWWNQHAHFIFIEATLNYKSQCQRYFMYTRLPIYYAILNAQFVCYHRPDVYLFSSNQFTSQAPPVWRFTAQVRLRGIKRPTSVFIRKYRKGGQNCEALNFPKTTDIGGWPVQFYAKNHRLYDDDVQFVKKLLDSLAEGQRVYFETTIREARWFRETISRVLNATAVVGPYPKNRFYEGSTVTAMGISLTHQQLSMASKLQQEMRPFMIFPMTDMPLFAVTNHTGHKTQLEKLLSVIDGTSRIGTGVVYLITFLFFKFFLGQAVMPSLLNLVRLTCNMGLPKLPNNLAPKIYLACLLMFVVTLQGIYTGNLATLLTTTVAYRNVQTKFDIPYLGYTVYGEGGSIVKVAADPILEGRVIEIPHSDKCIDYVLRDPLAACVKEEIMCLRNAIRWNLHISRDPIILEHRVYFSTGKNPLGRRLESVIRRFGEHGLWYKDPIIGTLRHVYVDDDEVKRNTDRRVMNLNDLCFAFVILGVGLLCSFICFVGEIVVCKIRLKMAKRRSWVRARLAWGDRNNYFLSFRSLNVRFNARPLFSRRR